MPDSNAFGVCDIAGSDAVINFIAVYKIAAAGVDIPFNMSAAACMDLSLCLIDLVTIASDDVATADISTDDYSSLANSLRIVSLSNCAVPIQHSLVRWLTGLWREMFL